MKRIIASLIIVCSLLSSVGQCSPPKTKPPTAAKRLPKEGDVLAVEVVLDKKMQIIIVRVKTDGIMEFIYNGRVYLFLDDLSKYNWEYYYMAP